MVKIEEVQDESKKVRQQDLNAEFDDGDEWEVTDDESDEEDFEDEVTEKGLVVPNETLWERISALRDILAPETRAAISKTFRVAWAYTFMGGWLTGKLIWIGVTSALLVGLPFALSVEDESRLITQEKEIASQQGGAPLMAPGAEGAIPADSPQGLRPPGF
ncbi:mitochondrial import receptor subunit Tom22 [Malassezia cuniculi]|uniref:Mitochondrial import receptor subunit Tom22 n=1 Tax=Malassezia cuniculi TaxID=948313 RepID=A0AAF0JA92_9BASI|nr:mitochondrial import receptor subunit Tom22 [Malassezia cuniculi]